MNRTNLSPTSSKKEPVNETSLTKRMRPNTIKLMKKEEKVVKETPEPQKKSSDYLELRIPRLSRKNFSVNGFLIFCLIVFAFLLGMLTNKVLYLEKANKEAATAPANNQNAAIDAGLTPPPQVVDIDSGKLPLLGESNAPVTIVTFSDFECPFCKRYFDDTHGQLVKDYVDTGKVNIAFRHFPLTGIHANAQKAGEASECANEQGNFWGYHDLLFDKQPDWSALSGTATVDAFTTYAGELGLDATAFRSCLESDKFKQAVLTDQTAGTGVQVDGTPTFFVNGYRVVGAVPYEELKQIIEDELTK